MSCSSISGSRADAEVFRPGKRSGPRSKDQRTPPVPTARGFSFLAIGSRCHRPGRCAEARTKSRQAGRSDIRFVIYGDIVQREDFWPATRKSRFESECLHQFAGVVQRLRIRPCHGRDAGSTPAVRSNIRRVDQWQIGSLIRIRSEVRSQPPEPVSSVPGVTAALGAPTSAVRVQILGGVPTRRDGRSAMPRPAKPLSPVRLRSATPFRRWVSFNSRTALCDGVNLGAAPSIHPSPAS